MSNEKGEVVQLFGRRPASEAKIDPKELIENSLLKLCGEEDQSALPLHARVMVRLIEIERFLCSLQGIRRDEENIRLRMDGLRENEFEINAEILLKSNSFQWSKSPSYYWALIRVLEAQLYSKRKKR